MSRDHKVTLSFDVDESDVERVFDLLHAVGKAMTTGDISSITVSSTVVPLYQCNQHQRPDGKWCGWSGVRYTMAYDQPGCPFACPGSKVEVI